MQSTKGFFFVHHLSHTLSVTCLSYIPTIKEQSSSYIQLTCDPLFFKFQPKMSPIISMKPAQSILECFDPEKHIDFTPPSKIYSMRDIKLPEHRGVSPVAVSEPFKMFTPEAIQRMRSEILSKDVWENCQYSSNLSKKQLRGFASE